MSVFRRYIGIDYSGAGTSAKGLSGIRVYISYPECEAVEVLSQNGRSRYWSRRGLALWLNEIIKDGTPTITGIDHNFSFPKQYFDKYGLACNWDIFLKDFCEHWPTDMDDVTVRELRAGSDRTGQSRWRRISEMRTGKAKSVFHFDVPGTVANSSHAGIPWLNYIRKTAGESLHFWPYDGWDVPEGKSVMVEAYPSLYSRSYDIQNRTQDQHDAYSVSMFLRDADRDGRLQKLFRPKLTDEERSIAEYEGWILGV